MKIASVNLTDNVIEYTEVDDGVLTVLAGGRGLGVGLLERIGFKGGALEPRSPLIISLGPLIGTGFPLANRLTMVFRSPLTGTVAWAQTGGYAGYEMASLGLSAIIITGAAEKLSYLQVDVSGISIVEAGWLKGQGAVETCAQLRSRLGDVRVLSVGPAGENLVKIATVINDMGRSSGVRHGVGAILGSKNLKAIVFRGVRQMRRKPYDGTAFTQLLRKLQLKLRQSHLLNHEQGLLSVHGTAIAAEAIGRCEALPVKNYRLTSHERYETVGGHAMSSTVLINRLTCSVCPVSCRRETVGMGVRSEGPDYAQISSLGTNCMLFNLEQISYLTYLCYDLGLDPIEMGNTLAVYAELSERGAVKDRPCWGDFNQMAQLITQTANRSGVGAILGHGAHETARQFNMPDIAPSIKGISIQNADPRVEHAWGLLNAVESFGGAAHIWIYPRLIKSFQTFGINTIHDPSLADGVYAAQVRVAALDSLGVCAFSNLAFQDEEYIDGVKYFYGVKLEDDMLREIGMRILAIERSLNESYGFDESSDILPKRFLEEPVPTGVNKGLVCPLRTLLREYRHIRRDPPISETLTLLPHFTS